MFILHDVLEGNREKAFVYGSRIVDGSLSFRAACHDSRQVQHGDLYVAIKGARVDGHQFLAAALRAGAIGALCTEPDKDLPADFLQIVVSDSIQALQATARVRVQRQPETLRIGITGSSGKTMTKEAIAAVLRRKSPTLKTQASFNNELGLPLTLLGLEPEHCYAVLEMGAERVGELQGLCEQMASPHWSVITTVGSAHLLHFGSVENVALAKSELVQCLSANGFALLNYDDPKVRAMASKTRAHVVFYGRGEKALVRGSDIQGSQLTGCRFTLHVAGEKTQVQLRLPGEHGITAALAAAAAGYLADVPLDEIRNGLESLETPHGRGEIKPGPNGSTLIDDTYNAIRQSILAMTHTMQATQLQLGGKRWAVMGELLEQGEHAQEEHEASGEALAGAVDYLIAIGDNARFFVEGARRAGMPGQHIFYFPAHPGNSAEVEEAKAEAARLLNARVQQSDLVLLKGSRGMRMETMLDMLTVC
jgi:UDP-N-acetylmuramoyl-tripeptide--D-alanyl-D-alanine ligase